MNARLVARAGSFTLWTFQSVVRTRRNLARSGGVMDVRPFAPARRAVPAWAGRQLVKPLVPGVQQLDHRGIA